MPNDLVAAAELDGGLGEFSEMMEAEDRQRRQSQPPPPFRPTGTRGPRAEGLDWCSVAGAQALAAKIRAFWEQAGYSIELTMFRTPHGAEDNRGVMSIRSNLLGGLPPRQND